MSSSFAGFEREHLKGRSVNRDKGDYNMPDSDTNVMAVDTAINSDGYAPGIAQPTTLDEIKDIYMSETSKSDRLAQLREIRQEMVARNSADSEAGFDDLIAEIDRGIDYLNGKGEGTATASSLENKDTAVNPENL